jgi:hypothetical protein
MIYAMAEKIETRWDGITTVAATAGITIIAALGVSTGQVGTESIVLTIAALSGIGGYSMHNLVRRGGKK